MALSRALAAAALAASGCASTDPCAGYSTPGMLCVGLRLVGPSLAFDDLQVELRTDNGSRDQHGDSPGAATLPALTRLEVPEGWAGVNTLVVTLLRGNVLAGSGTARPTLVAPVTPTVEVEIEAAAGDLAGADLAADLRVSDGPRGDAFAFGTADLAGADLATADLAPLPCPNGLDFCDDFEAGKDWGSTQTQGTAIIQRQVGIAHSGTAALHAIDDGSGGAQFYIHSLNNRTTGRYAMRFFAYFETVPQGFYTSYAGFGTGNNGPQIVADAMNGNELWKLWVGDGAQQVLFDNGNLVIGAWYCMEVDLDLDVPRMDLWEDGVMIGTVTPSAAHSQLLALYFGLLSTPGMMQPSSTYLDDVAIGPVAHIGCN